MAEKPGKATSALVNDANNHDTLDDPARSSIKRTSNFLKQITRLGSGIRRDIQARAPWYWSDWKDAWNYRVVPATALIFFAKCVWYSLCRTI